MEVSKDIKNEEVKINQEYECNACQSMEHLQVGDSDHVVMGFGNGKVLKLEFNSLNQDKDTSVVDQAMRAAEYNNLM
jgi:hypothetical protein